MTHQIFIQAPLGRFLLEQINKRFIARHTECWIPDFAGQENLSGMLSHRKVLGANYHFVGPLSRIQGEIKAPLTKCDYLVILSGPEPQRTAFEQEILLQVAELPGTGTVVLGKTDSQECYHIGNAEVLAHLPASEIRQYLENAGVIICRSGYSSIMDLAAAGKRCVFVPTPGQTEQEYLAGYHQSKGHCIVQQQREMDLKIALKEAGSIPGFAGQQGSRHQLRNRIRALLR